MKNIKLLCPVKLPDGRIAPAREVVTVADDLALRMTDGELAELEIERATKAGKEK